MIDLQKYFTCEYCKKPKKNDQNLFYVFFRAIWEIDWKFVFVPIPMILLLSYAFASFGRLGDFSPHLEYKGDAGYPRGVAYIVNALSALLPREGALFLLNLLVAVVLPYILIFHITRSQLASWVYVYGSNIATTLFQLWFVPQAVIQVFMLASAAYPPFLIVFALVGSSFHNAWLLAFCLISLHILVRRLIYEFDFEDRMEKCRSDVASWIQT